MYLNARNASGKSGASLKAPKSMPDKSNRAERSMSVSVSVLTLLHP
jgi:hypothetical protein